MYFSKNKHLLSHSIMAAAVIRLLMSSLEGLFRIYAGRSAAFTPDMLDKAMWRVQAVSAGVQITAISIVFFIAVRKLRHYKKLVEDDDYFDMGRLQEEVLGKNLSTLGAEAIGQLLQIWAVVLVGAELIYYISSAVYRRFTAELLLLLAAAFQGEAFVSLYNLSHGFKYLEMMTALLLGVAMTGIFLKDRLLKFTAAAIGAVFLICFVFFQMHTLVLPGRAVGIVWTSVIFHITDTIGLFVLSLYLAGRYKGL